MSTKQLTDLSNETLLAIASYLDWESALLLAATSKGFQRLLSQDRFWLEQMHSAGFSIPNRHREAHSAKKHVHALLAHYQSEGESCALCRHERTCCDETSSNERAVPVQVIAHLERQDSVAIISFEYGDPTLESEFCRVYLCREFHYHHWLKDGELFWLHDHPIFEGRLITTTPVFELACTIKGAWSYVDIDDDTGDDIVEEGYADIACGTLQNPTGITIDDLVAFYRQHLASHAALLDGSRYWENWYCEIEKPGELVFVIY